MSDGKINISKCPEPFTVLPRSFLQNSELSTDSIAVGVYLASQVENWTPHPSQIQKHFRFSDHVWRRVSKELKHAGYLTEIKGGHGKGGSELIFDIWKNLRHLSDQSEVPQLEVKRPISDPLKIRGSENPTVGKSTPLYNKDLLDNKDSLNNNNGTVVVLEKEMRELGVSESLIQKYLKDYLEEQIKIALKITKAAHPDKPHRYFSAALKKGYKLDEDKKPNSVIIQEQTNMCLQNVDESVVKARTPESKKARDEAMRKIKGVKK